MHKRQVECLPEQLLVHFLCRVVEIKPETERLTGPSVAIPLELEFLEIPNSRIVGLLKFRGNLLTALMIGSDWYLFLQLQIGKGIS